MSLKTIWISLRAIDYTVQAFNGLQRNINKIIKDEKDLAKQHEALRANALKATEATMMMFTLSAQMAGSILNMAMASRQGAGDMARLNQQIFLAKNSLNNAAYEFLKATKILDFLNWAMKGIADNKGVATLVIGLIALGAVLTAGLGIYTAYLAVSSLVTIKNAVVATSNNAVTTSTNTLNIATKNLAFSMAAVLGYFTMFLMLATAFKGTARIIVSAIMLIVAAYLLWTKAQAAATGGISLIGAGIGLAGATAMAGGLTGAFASGTQSVQKTGPIFAHKGEVVYNPATNRPLQVGNDMGRGSGSTTNMNTQITIENIHTKADYDDVAYQINKANRMGARSVR
jgi:hypothetical protein